ncbi:hypothetical protein [Roseibium sediminis]|uniref:hypothetical protein n=1 Tax=Roseibium sediminis TaxID=1775174 RepID=UPI00123D0982|nr:hypothetical protein [Roseibium sediminis]
MPFDRSEKVDPGPLARDMWDLSPPSDAKPEKGFFDALGPSFRTNNEVGAALVSETLWAGRDVLTTVDPDYQPDWKDIERTYPGFEGRFLEVFNSEHEKVVRADLDRELEDQAVIEAAGWGGTFSDVLAGTVSPTTFLPGGAFVKAGRIGYSAAKTAVSVGLSAGAGAAVQEAGLLVAKQSQDPVESGMVIGGSVIVGAILGAAGAQVFSASQFRKFSRALEEDLVDATPHPSEISQEIVRRMQSAGASAVDEINLDDLEIGGPRAVKAIANATAAVKLNPGLELLTSKSMKSRQVFLRLAENHVGTAAELEGRSLGAAVETNMKQWTRGALSRYLATQKLAFKEAKKAGFSGRQTQFNELVAKAARRGDVDPNGDPFVEKVAKAWRDEIANPLKDEGVAVQLLPEGVKVTTAPSYLYRIYNHKKILAGEGKFRDILRRHIKGEVEKAVGRQEEIEIARKINRATDLDEQLSRSRDRLTSIENRLGKRQEARGRKLGDIRRREGERFDLLKGRVPKEVIAAAKEARDDDVMVRAVAESHKAPPKLSKRPVINLLKDKGGVRIGSHLDQELRAIGVTPQTAPGLFKNGKGLSDADNLVAREEPLLSGMRVDQNGYADRDDILSAIADEMAGSPIRLDDELAIESARDALERNVSEWLDKIGLPPNATAKEVRDHLEKALRNEGKLSDLDQSVGKMWGDLDEFDKLSDEISNERLIADAEVRKFTDELTELENSINEVRQFANNSDRVKILVDYADTRKAYAKGRYEQSKLANRIDAIERLEAEGRLTPELDAELRALRADKAKVDERVIKAGHKADKLKPMLPKDRAEELDFSDDLDLESYVEEAVEATFNKIMGKTVDDTPSWMVPATQGPLKGRTLNIPDEMIEEFLENDMEMIARRYTRQMAAEVELTRRFGRADMKDQIAEIRADYQELRKAAKTDAERAKLNDQEKRDVRLVEAFRDMLRGTYRASDESSGWSAFTRMALAWNYIRLLGGVTLSSLPDMANVMTKNGLTEFMRTTLPMLSRETQALKIARRDAREWGAVTETILQSRLAELADLHDPYASGTMADRIMGNVTSGFSKLTFLDRWNDMNKSIVTVMTGNKVSRLLLSNITEVPDKWGVIGKQVSFDRLSKHEKTYLGKLGIDEAMGTRIADQIQKYGLEENGITGLNLRVWDDKEARRAMAAALNKEVDGTIITPGIADKPLWARSNTGKLVMQFKSFGLASHQRILLSRLQGRQKHLAEFLVLGSSLGMMVSYLKYIERGDYEGAKRLTENPGLWIADGFDRTGIASVLMDVSNTAEKLGSPLGFKSAAQGIAGDPDRGADVSRYATRNSAGAFLGPSIGVLRDLATIASQAANGGLDKQGARALIRQVPGATLPIARSVIQTQIKPMLETATD